jgi:general secretion pathway protein M
MSTLTLPAPLSNLRQRASTGWRALSPRDRALAALAASVVGALLLWLVGIQPALRTLREAPALIEQLGAETQQMQILAAESRTLRAAPAVAPGQAAVAMKAAVARLGDKARLVLQGERATVTLSGVDGASLRSFLGEARSAARARPVEAQLVRGAQGYDGTLTFSLGNPP